MSLDTLRSFFLKPQPLVHVFENCMPELSWEKADSPEISHFAVLLKIGSKIRQGQEAGTMEVGWICTLEIE